MAINAASNTTGPFRCWREKQNLMISTLSFFSNAILIILFQSLAYSLVWDKVPVWRMFSSLLLQKLE